ncbi:MAG: glycolate oxidase subunit GlcF [Rhodospirillales bacterium]
MQTLFSAEQLANPVMREANAILRTCVHCGFCTATCPTYLLLGDELDSPRGRIYQIKDVLENAKPATDKLAKHVDRCLSCLGCMTTCPSGVHYMHLIDQTRAHIEETYRRPWHDRLLRAVLAKVIPNPSLFRLSLLAAKLAAPFEGLISGLDHPLAKRLGGMLGLAPGRLAKPSTCDRPQTFAAQGERRKRAVLMTGCAQQVLDPTINEATIRLLNRLGVEVVIAKGAGCCGALTHHMGREDEAKRSARTNIEAWWREQQKGGLDYVVINASGCGTTVKDYGHLFRHDPDIAEKASAVAGLARDITEVLDDLGLGDRAADDRAADESRAQLTIAYHSACSMQHGQKITTLPKRLLSQAGFRVVDVPEGHICCGSAGVYNILQPDIAAQLKARKVAHIESVKPDLVATGNIGCMAQIGSATRLPVVHTVSLLDWATGGPKPDIGTP